jgi:hypothetical protein
MNQTARVPLAGHSNESSGPDDPLVLKIIVVVALPAYRRDKTKLCLAGSVMVDRAANFPLGLAGILVGGILGVKALSSAALEQCRRADPGGRAW